MDMTSPIYGASANGGAMVTLTNCGPKAGNVRSFSVETDKVDKDFLLGG